MKSRTDEFKNIDGNQFDLCVIGGGATGSACALDAQLRGIRTVLLEAGDFAGATSSAATKIKYAAAPVEPRDYKIEIRLLTGKTDAVLIPLSRNLVVDSPDIAHCTSSRR